MQTPKLGQRMAAIHCKWDLVLQAAISDMNCPVRVDCVNYTVYYLKYIQSYRLIRGQRLLLLVICVCECSVRAESGIGNMRNTSVLCASALALAMAMAGGQILNLSH